MADQVITETVPLATDAGGVIRIGGTRVTLETIVDAFEDGATPEEIAHQYPSVSLSDVYQVIAYYLKHSDELKRYLDAARELRLAVRRKVETLHPSAGIRDRLLARRRH